MSRLSIFGLLGVLALALFWLVMRGADSRNGSSPVGPAPSAAPGTSAPAAELVAPATSAEEASLPVASAEGRAHRDPASEERVTIAGRVVVTEAIPANESASVTAYVEEGDQPGSPRFVSAPIAADGSFTLVVPPDTRYALLDIAGRALHLDEAVRALPGQQDVVLHPIVLAASVHGRVILPLGATLEANQDAWSGVEVWCQPADVHASTSVGFRDLPFEPLTRPDAQGEFEFPFLPSAVPLSLRVVHPFGPAEGRELEPLLAGERRELLITLERGITVAGRVLDQHDRPVEGASISARSRTGAAVSGEDVKTDAEGRFSLSKLPRTSLEIDADGEDLLDLDFGEALVDGAAGGVNGLELHVTRGACIEGTVVWPDGTPAQRFEIHAFGAMVASEGAENGRFRLRVVEDGLYDLEVTAARETVVGTARIRGIRAGGPTLALVLETKAAVEVDGTVVDDGGEPVRSFSVGWETQVSEFRVGRSESKTSRIGHFHLGGLWPGALSITVRADGFRACTQTLEIGARPSEPLRFVLTRAGVVRGHVVDRDGRGVADADVASDPGDESCRTAEDGAFELAPDASALRLVARKEGYAPSEVLELELASGEVVEGVSLRLRESCRIEGRVLDAGGRPVESAWVGAESLASTETDASGTFVLADLPPGVQEIVAELPSSSTQIVRASVDLRPGRTATLELRFDEPDPVRLHGQIRRRGKPLACWLVLQSSTSRAESLVGDDGRYEETLAHPGDFVGELWIGGPAGREGRRLELHVPDADEFAFEIDFDALPRIDK